MNQNDLNAFAAASAPELRNLTIPIGQIFRFIRRTIRDLAGRTQPSRALESNPGTQVGRRQLHVRHIQVDDLANATWEDAAWQ